MKNKGGQEEGKKAMPKQGDLQGKAQIQYRNGLLIFMLVMGWKKREGRGGSNERWYYRDSKPHSLKKRHMPVYRVRRDCQEESDPENNVQRG